MLNKISSELPLIIYNKTSSGRFNDNDFKSERKSKMD